MSISYDPDLFRGPAVDIPAPAWWQVEPLVDADPWPVLVEPAALDDPVFRTDERRAER